MVSRHQEPKVAEDLGAEFEDFDQQEENSLNILESTS
jgi:hypothetical protein